ncbi:norrin-like [Gigantopelta aegis]|uniref:norrin-like n=1 Tax=Gigantopelta aegis TaxID=1735272 RepID=UPI001B88A344|nr:norrin-like [Gigantopelta aegis]
MKVFSSTVHGTCSKTHLIDTAAASGFNSQRSFHNSGSKMTSVCGNYFPSLICTMVCFGCICVMAVRRENRCMRHYFVETVRHPRKQCETRNILLARCEGFCYKSRTLPRVSFSPVLYRPFRYVCTCCRDVLSIMKAVALQCEGEETVFATYRYIIKCGCEHCGSKYG